MVNIIITSGAAFASTARFYESSRIIETFKVFEKFKLSNKPEWLLYQLPKDFSFIDKLIQNSPFQAESSLGTVLAASLNTDYFDLSYGIKKRISRLNRASIDPLIGDKNESTGFNNYWELGKVKTIDEILKNVNLCNM